MLYMNLAQLMLMSKGATGDFVIDESADYFLKHLVVKYRAEHQFVHTAKKRNTPLHTTPRKWTKNSLIEMN